MKCTQSTDAYKEAVDLMPGGVNSPVRAFASVGMSPIFMEKGSGSTITDI
ncbi:MAG TPA: aspartate aminotransferase family protein, partial [Bacillota bacterium]|nr:aspartate aminotransferase family protein [Bacillota bacterium]